MCGNIYTNSTCRPIGATEKACAHSKAPNATAHMATIDDLCHPQQRAWRQKQTLDRTLRVEYDTATARASQDADPTSPHGPSQQPIVTDFPSLHTSPRPHDDALPATARPYTAAMRCLPPQHPPFPPLPRFSALPHPARARRPLDHLSGGRDSLIITLRMQASGMKVQAVARTFVRSGRTWSAAAAMLPSAAAMLARPLARAAPLQQLAVGAACGTAMLGMSGALDLQDPCEGAPFSTPPPRPRPPVSCAVVM